MQIQFSCENARYLRNPETEDIHVCKSTEKWLAGWLANQVWLYRIVNISPLQYFPQTRKPFGVLSHSIESANQQSGSHTIIFTTERNQKQINAKRYIWCTQIHSIEIVIRKKWKKKQNAKCERAQIERVFSELHSLLDRTFDKVWIDFTSFFFACKNQWKSYKLRRSRKIMELNTIIFIKVKLPASLSACMVFWIIK